MPHRSRTSFSFRLYMAGDAPNSIEALTNLRELCRRHLPRRHQIELVNVFRHGKRALADGIFLTPTLVTLSPHSVRRIVGTLSDSRTVLQALGLPTHGP